MVCDDHMWIGRMPFRIAVGTLLVFLALVGGVSAHSNDGGGGWRENEMMNLEYFVGNGIMQIQCQGEKYGRE